MFKSPIGVHFVNQLVRIWENIHYGYVHSFRISHLSWCSILLIVVPRVGHYIRKEKKTSLIWSSHQFVVCVLLPGLLSFPSAKRKWTFSVILQDVMSSIKDEMLHVKLLKGSFFIRYQYKRRGWKTTGWIYHQSYWYKLYQKTTRPYDTFCGL